MTTANKQQPETQEVFAVRAKKRLLEMGLTVTALAHRLGYARNTVSMAINHETLLPSVRNRISKELNL